MTNNFKSEFEHFWRKYIFAQEVYDYTEYCHHPKTKEEHDIVVSGFPGCDIRFIMHVLFRTLIVEVCKLVNHSKNDHPNLYSILNSLKDTTVDESFVNEIRREINQQAKNNLIALRNKLYAHSDIVKIDIDAIDITFVEIKQLLDLVYKVILHVGKVLFDTEYLNSAFFDRDKFIILELLAKGEQQRLDDLHSEAKNDIANIRKIKMK